MRLGLAALCIAVFASAFGATFSAFTSTTGNAGNGLSAGTVTLSDNDSGVAMLGLSGAPLGASDTSCIRTSYSGSLPSNVRHHATVAGSLAPYLSLKVTRGGGSAGFDNCTGFTPDTTNYVGAGPGVIYNGKLSDYPTSWAAGIVDPADTAPNPYSPAVLGTSGLVSYWRLGEKGAVVSDTFTDTAGVLLQGHTGELGATWTRYSSSATDGVISTENRLRRNGANAATYYASGVPSSADYSVAADVHVKSILGSDSAGVIGRASTSADTYYLAQYSSTGATATWELIKAVGGSLTPLGSYTQTLVAGSTYRLKLDMQGSTIRLLVGGVQRVSVSDSSITAGGRAGVGLGYTGATDVPTSTTGLHLDNLTAPPAVDSKATNDGTYANGVTLGVAGALAGDTNTAAQFNGTSGTVTVPNQASLQLTGSFTIEAWVNPNVVTGTQFILNKDTFYYLYLIGSDVVFGYRGGGLYKWVYATGAATAGSWQHFVGTYNRSTLSFYRNGVRLLSAASSGPVDVGTSNLFIGSIGGGSYFSGTIDEAALYNVALTEADVATHYAAALATETWFTSESHDYKFEITLDNDVAAEGLSSTATFVSEARNT